MGGVAHRLRDLGIEVPARRSYGKYVGAARAGDLVFVFVSGAGPIGPNGVISGKVGSDVDIEKAQEAARLCVINCLSALQEELGDLENVARVVKLLGFVNGAPGFTQQHVVMDGASALPPRHLR
jgi:enamine deaminase RidA (YjgF/YER057c/UK114 family)